MKPSEFYTVVGLRSLFLSSARCWLNAKCCAVRSVRNVFFHFFVVVSYVCVECDAQRCRICVTRVHVSMRIWRSRLFCPKRAREATGRLCVKCFFFRYFVKMLFWCLFFHFVSTAEWFILIWFVAAFAVASQLSICRRRILYLCTCQVPRGWKTAVIPLQRTCTRTSSPLLHAVSFDLFSFRKTTI